MMKRFWHGFRRREPKRKGRWFGIEFSSELTAMLANIALYIVGETIKGRALRIALTAIIAGAVAWYSPTSSLSISLSSSPPNTTEAQQRIATASVLPDSHRTAPDR